MLQKHFGHRSRHRVQRQNQSFWLRVKTPNLGDRPKLTFQELIQNSKFKEKSRKQYFAGRIKTHIFGLIEQNQNFYKQQKSTNPRKKFKAENLRTELQHQSTGSSQSQKFTCRAEIKQ